MSLSVDLLEQARHLSHRETTRPKQASLRRAISAAYYALFHLLVEEASAKLVKEVRLRAVVSRAFDHSEMKRVCKPFANGTLPKHILRAGVSNVPTPLRNVARAFGNLQEARHQADYDSFARFTRAGVNALIEEVERAFSDWEAIRPHDATNGFLVSLLLSEKWKDRV